MDSLVFPFRSRPPKGGAGIAGKSGSPVSGSFGNRGKAFLIAAPPSLTVPFHDQSKPHIRYSESDAEALASRIKDSATGSTIDQ